jgi:N-acetylhexosamine 1-kinase
VTADAEAGRVAALFDLPDAPAQCVRLDGGHINGTWRAGTDLLIQRLNPAVFPDGAAVMHNVLQVTRRVGPPLRLVPLRNGAWWHTAPDGAVWRGYGLINGAAVHHTADSPALAEAAARAFGEFARRTAEPALALHEVIPGFHDTRARLRQLAHAFECDAAGRAASVAAECRRVLAEPALAARIPLALETGRIPRRVAHNDAKIANVLFAAGTDTPLCVIDLDTVMPGTPLHDFGDLVRSMVGSAAEDAADPSHMEVRRDYFEAIVRGYFEGTAGLLTAGERELLVDAARSIALEQAARFLADYLDGDTYYRVADAQQNARRARTQLALFDALTSSADELGQMVAGSG